MHVRERLLKVMVDGIKYQKLSETDIWAQSLFESAELIGYLKSASDEGNLVETRSRGLYDYVIYDSEVERAFAEELEKSADVKLFAKLPGWFTIPTPLGTYNPDWAVVLEKEGEERLYFVVETKGTDQAGKISDEQNMKIECGKAHFLAIGLSRDGNDYIGPVKTAEDFRKRALQ